MIISFNIEYRTRWGEELAVTVSCMGNVVKIPLATKDGIKWSGTFRGAVRPGGEVSYYYSVYLYGKETRREFVQTRRVITNSHAGEHVFNVYDSWKDIPQMRLFYSSPFTEVFMKHEKAETPVTTNSELVIKAYCPYIPQNCVPRICGNQEALGNWDTAAAPDMNPTALPEYEIRLDLDKVKFPVEYKFILFDTSKNEVECWEENPNRYISDSFVKPGETTVISDRYVNFNLAEWRAAGVAIPVFSIRTEDGFGVGDFHDLKKMADWAKATGQRIIQLLPVNDTTATHTWRDSYPYNGISVYALNPIYIHLDSLGTVPARIRKKFDKMKEELNACPQIDFDKVIKAKEEYVKEAYKANGARVMAGDSYKAFFERNREWLEPYALFCVLRDRYNTSDFRQWGKYASFDRKLVSSLPAADADVRAQMDYHCFVQYHLDRQLRDAAEYAHSCGIVLKGDIPIGINPCSVEAWTEGRYFNLNSQAGAPPDGFAADGQNWGFPTYNWDEMEKDNYAWWRKRFAKMSEYFDAYRIDHILGFFRIWSIPTEYVHGLMGHFSPALPLSREEIESFGLVFDEELFTTPHVTHESLECYVGGDAEKVVKAFLKFDAKSGIYRFRKECDTQRKLLQYVAVHPELGFEKKTLDGVMRLMCNVLFLRDSVQTDRFHPRIDSYKEEAYRKLLDEQGKKAFGRLYENFFYHRHNDFWREQAMKKLPMLTESTSMLACGEDLGMIPGCVPEVMKSLQILSLEIQRMPKQFGIEFDSPACYPYTSVCTISTHDTSTLRGWWKEDAAKTQRFYNNVLGHWGDAPLEASGALCKEVVKMHLKSKSVFCILTLQDWLSMDEQVRCKHIDMERINEPANPNHYWRYRMHVTVEELLANEGMNGNILRMIKESGRL